MLEKKFFRAKVADLIPYERNPRKITQEAIDDVRESYKLCGELDPIEVDENMVILSGHTRRLAALQEGIEEVDIIQYIGLTEEQKRMYRVLANKTAERAKWDAELLKWEISDLDFGGYDFGFKLPDEDELKKEKPEVQFTEVLGEDHNYIVLYFDNTVDWLQMQSIIDIDGKMNLSTRKDGTIGKNMKRISVGRVFRGADVLERMREHFENLH